MVFPNKLIGKLAAAVVAVEARNAFNVFGAFIRIAFCLRGFDRFNIFVIARAFLAITVFFVRAITQLASKTRPYNFKHRVTAQTAN
jgi:hypothetical protein